MDNKQYEKVIAHLESKVDQLEAELVYLNKILIEVGFTDGISTLKQSVEELIEEESEVVKKSY
jgi:exonuclease VII small subunit